ncbi:hypothetical protein ACFQ48_01640 [Hymenobacter caeli]|uniref:Uncharacterized protein n=1 Tax=Hymenobacter caeli TaxID=2735894 RepID=A0ABX2FM07_9BACT|nr:hypothetical protein [Hymenobacter caeli]NRT17525.1 hypothetical protein [Hymenobacter caeli]
MKILLLFLLCCTLISYFIYRREVTPVPPLLSKRVAGKPLPLKTGGAPGLDNPLYYLVADDGTRAEVGPSTYAATAVGDWYASREWQEGARS